MNDMPWLDGLTEQQTHLADMIVHKAKKEGVDPRLALALAFRESSLKHGNFEKDDKGNLVFKPLTGTSGEVGVMQVTPGAAKFHGFKPEDLNNLERNMEIGLKVLKSHLGKFNDPVMAAAAYNAGPNHPYFKDPDNNPLPESTKQYLRDISGYGGFAAPVPEAEESGEPGAEPLTLSEDIGGDEQPPGLKEQFKEQIPGLVGAGAGAATGVTLATGKKALRGMDLFADFMRSRVGAGPVQLSGIDIPTPAMPGTAADTSGTKWMRNWAGSDRQIQGGVPEASAAYQRSKGQGKVTGSISKRFGPAALQPGGLSIQGQAAFPAPPAPPATSLLDDAVSKLGQIARGGMRMLGSQPVAGALGGYGAAMSGVEAFQREKQGDRPGAILSGIGTLGALSAIPTPPTVAAGMAASVISPLSLMMLGKYRKIKAEPQPAPATPQEMYQAQQPAFTAQRP
jgi:hypothetical protein